MTLKADTRKGDKILATYERTFTHEEKVNKLKKFNSVYYNGNAKNWKICRLPNWMEFYGNSLQKELDDKLPKYYRKFKQGTIVMVDYGVTVGNEMAGMHFAVVLSSKDTKYNKNIIVAPLSSKYHKGYVDLGYEPLLGAEKLFNDKVSNLEKEIQNVLTNLENFEQNHELKKHFSLSPATSDFLRKNNIIDLPNLKFTISPDKNINSDFKNLIATIKKLDSWVEFPDLFEFVSYSDTLMEFSDSLIKKATMLKNEVQNAKKLRDEISKYNNRSYVNVSEIRSLSKLRVSKFSYLSGNISVSKDSLALIKSKLLNII